MSSNKKNLLKTLLTVNAGCGCSRPKLSDAYEPKPKPKTPQNPTLCSSSAIENDDLTSTSFSLNNIDTVSSSTTTDLPTLSKVKLSRHCTKIDDSIPVVKDSNDPYNDFRHSMLQMIVEKRIYSKDELEELLQCFLELNSRCHHLVIVKAFMEIKNRVISNQIVTVEDHEGEKPGS